MKDEWSWRRDQEVEWEIKNYVGGDRLDEGRMKMKKGFVKLNEGLRIDGGGI